MASSSSRRSSSKKVRGAGDRSQRKAMIETGYSKLSIRRQSALLGVNRNRLTSNPTPTTEEDRMIMCHLDELHTRWPFLGQRKLIRELRDQGIKIGRKRLRRLMRMMGIEAIAPKPKLSAPAKGHKIYPYLLRNGKVSEVDEVWCTDITYIPMATGHAYLIAIMDWHSRAVLRWELSNTADTGMCLRALAKALGSVRRPKIFNTDQGSQFTSAEWTKEIESNGIKVSMDGKGRWMDNVFIERLWRSLKVEKTRLWSYDSIPE
ncbi:IS3 family transposase, partial [Verrucomicrobiales bacterium]|nr:IS3 family transposase [Verrucomicrobiales bacterium]